MVKPEWGTKRTCPKCATRFYDLGNEDPVVCINCSNQWIPESVLKSKQPLPFEEVKQVPEKQEEGDLAADLDLDADVDDGEISPDNDVDLGGDDDLGVEAPDKDSEEN